jgi:hypothetical protein
MNFEFHCVCPSKDIAPEGGESKKKNDIGNSLSTGVNAWAREKKPVEAFQTTNFFTFNPTLTLSVNPSPPRSD